MRRTAVVRAWAEPRSPFRHANGGETAGRWISSTSMAAIFTRHIIIRMMICRVKIAAIDVELIHLPAVSPPFAWRKGLRGSAQARTTAVLRITTDEGAVGEAYHEWSGPMLADIVDRILRDELVGERADRREWLWHRLWELDRTEEFPIWLFGVVDVALWDLEGRVLGVPAHRLLGPYRDSIPAT